MRNLYPLARRLRIVSKTIGSRLSLFFLLFGLTVASASAQTTRYVNASATAGGDGSSWATAFNDLQVAINASASGDEIWVAKGTYKPTRDASYAIPSDSRRKTFFLLNGIKLYGGFAGTETSVSTRNIASNPTILSGDINGDDGAAFSGNAENAYHVVSTTALTMTTILDGFTISGGNADYYNSEAFLGEAYAYGKGSGLYISNAGTYLSVNNCSFTNNNTIFSDGCIYITSSDPSFNNCIIMKNQGSGITSWDASYSITNSVIAENKSHRGAGIWCNSFSSSSIVNINNCTIYGNTATGEAGGGVLAWNSARVIIKNSIVWGNTAPSAPFNVHASNPTIQVTYSNIQEGFAGTGNIDSDPLFVDALDLDGSDDILGTADDGLNLGIGSPSANTGSNADIPAGVTTDIIGDPRIKNGVVNMGAYETDAPRLAQTVSFSAGATVTKIYGDAYSVSATASSGLPVTYSIVSGPATISGSAVTFTGVGSVVVKAEQPGDATYDPANATQTITVVKRDITVTADALSKVYGDADPALTYTITAGSLVGSDAFSGTLKRFAGETAGQTYAIEQNTLALSSNYNLTYVSDWLTINKRAITITANDASKFAGETTTFAGNEYSVTTGSLATGDAISSISLSSTGESAAATAGTYPIIVSGAVGLSTTNYDITYVDGTLTINPCTAPAITAHPADQTVCPAGSVTFTVSATGTGLNYKWLKDGAAISGATSSSYTISSVAAGDAANYSVEVYNGCGTETSTVATLSVNVSTRITTQPVAESLCETATANFSVVATGSNLTYQWYKDGSPITNATSATLSLPGATTAQAGNYSVVVSGDCGNETSASVALTVLPITAITTDPVSEAVCEGGSVTFSGNAVGTGITYKWQKDGSDISGAFSNSYTIATVTAADAGRYTLVATTACGVATSTEAILTVNAIPATPTIGTSSATTFCAGSSVILTSSATSGNQWYKDGIAIGSATAQTYTATTSGNYTVQSTLSACPSPVSAGTAVTVNPTPAAATISASGALTFCSGGSVTLTSSVASGNQWYNGSTLIPGETSQTYTATTSGDYNVQVTDLGCTSPASATTAVTVNVTPTTPTISTGSSTTFCAGNSVTLTSSSASGNQWYKDGAAIGGATAQTYMATTSGNYTVKVTSGSCTSAASAATVVTVNPTPAIPVITATGNILSSSAATSNQWYLNGSAITGATGQTHRVQASGLYKVQVTSGSCTSTSVDYNFVATRIDNPGTWNNEVTLYPNPVVKSLTVNNAGSRKLQVRIYDGFGKQVHVSKLLTAQGTIDVQGWSAGVYHVVITDLTNQKSITQTIVKQ